MSGFNPVRFLRAGVLVFLLFLTILPVLSANPFLSGENSAEKPEKEEVRPARSGGSTSGTLTEIQFGFRERAATLLQAIKEKPDLSLYLGLGLAAFFYGLFHGAGPGHRKTIVFSLFLGRKTRWWEPLAGGFLAAGVHAGVSLIIILLFHFIIKGISLINSASIASVYLEGGTYLLLALISTLLLVLNIVRGGHHHHGHDLADDPAHEQDRKGNRQIYSIILASSLLPCPGATMILMFSISLGLLGTGIFALLCMSVGMGVVISAAGYLAYAGREGIFRRFKNNEVWFDRISGLLEKGAYLFIIIFSLYMAWPFLVSLSLFS